MGVVQPRATETTSAGHLDYEGRVAGTIDFSYVDGPGNRFVAFLQGCNLNCLFCHNPQTIPARGGTSYTVGSLVDEIRSAAPFLTGVTVSGGEATQQPEFLFHLFSALAEDPVTEDLSRFIDTNGDADEAVWNLLDPVFHQAMVDLKAIDHGVHAKLTGHGNERVLRTIKLLAERDKLYEVRLILAAGANDSDDALRMTGEFLAAIDPTLRLRINTYRSHGVRRAAARLLTPPSEEDRDRYLDILTNMAEFDIHLV